MITTSAKALSMFANNRLNSEKFQNFHFQAQNVIFEGKHKNDNQREFWDFNEFTLYMIFEIFHENRHDQNGHLQKNLKNHI